MKTESWTLIRKRLKYGPDGESVPVTDRVEVSITWPDGEPKNPGGYDTAGEWVLLPPAQEKTP